MQFIYLDMTYAQKEASSNPLFKSKLEIKLDSFLIETGSMVSHDDDSTKRKHEINYDIWHTKYYGEILYPISM